MARFDEYAHRYEPRFRLERDDDGILTVSWKQWEMSEMQPGKSILLDFPPPLQMAEPVWNDIAADTQNAVMILTGTEDTFYSFGQGIRGGRYDADIWSRVLRGVTRSIDAFLDLPMITIGAANGPATVHAEYLMMCDIVVAAENAVFADGVHYTTDMVPGDGVNVIWPFLLGWRQGVDFLLTGRSISAHEALELGLVREVVPHRELLPRCRELARELSSAGAVTRRLTAVSLRRRLRRMMLEELHHSLALEGLVFIDRNREQGQNP
jgi:enoyl-CoA hydratase/carnithine racemase